jgi:hypothetical protein
MLWFPSPPLYTKSGGETIKAASVKKALATSQPIFKLESPISLSQGRILWKDKETDSAGVSFQDFLMVAKASRRSASLPIHQIRLQWIFFCFKEAKSKLVELSLSQGGLMTNLERVTQISSKSILAVDGPL